MKKGIILAGGEGTRLHPMTKVVTKQLLPVYDKPLIYYPLSILMLMNVRDVLIITKPEDLPLFERLLGHGEHLGVKITYKIQLAPRGIPDAFILGRDFIGNDPVTLILGDNILYGAGLVTFINDCLSSHAGGSVFTFNVKDPERFGVVNFNDDGSVAALEEKPDNPKSRWAMAGLYHFDSDVVDIAGDLDPSDRGETEIVDVLKAYHAQGRLQAHRMARGFAWLDTGTCDAMMEAGKYVQILEERQGIKIACIEEIAFLKGWISKNDLSNLAGPLMKSGYGKYLTRLIKE